MPIVKMSIYSYYFLEYQEAAQLLSKFIEPV
jgi:hypothetical protein